MLVVKFDVKSEAHNEMLLNIIEFRVAIFVQYVLPVRHAVHVTKMFSQSTMFFLAVAIFNPHRSPNVQGSTL